MTEARSETADGRPRVEGRAGARVRLAVGFPLLVLLLAALVGSVVWSGVPAEESDLEAAGAIVVLLLAVMSGLMIFVTSMNLNVRYLWILRRKRDSLALRKTEDSLARRTAEESLARRTAEEVRALQVSEDLLVARRFARGAGVAVVVITAVGILATVVLTALDSGTLARFVLVLTIIHSVLIAPFALWTMTGVGATFRGDRAGAHRAPRTNP